MLSFTFHPAVREWFEATFEAATEAQVAAWPAIAAGRDTLVAAPTGSGKTLAAFLAAIDDLVRQSREGVLPDATQVVYVSPLKALSNDIHRNLQEPLAGIDAVLERHGERPSGIRVLVRTGDTPQSERAAMTRRPPHLIVTTPESLYILLTSDGGRRMLRTTRTVIVDEAHALAGNKRGSHLALSLERLDALVREHAAAEAEGDPPARATRPVRIGLSATQKPLDEMARFLVGTREGTRMEGVGRVIATEVAGETDAAATTEPPTIIDCGHARQLDLAIEMPGSPLEAVMAAEVWDEIYDRLAAHIQQHRTTLVFVNTRRLAERVARHLADRLGAAHVTAHHGSLAREHRQRAEQRLKRGELRALVATASLELGIDIGDVDLVCQIGSVRSIATFLQRVGRAGHGVGRVPRGRIFPLSRDELVESVALLDAIGRGELDRLSVPRKPLDIAAQQMVATVASCGEITEDALFDLLRGAYPYRDLTRDEFDDLVRMLADGFTTRRGRRSAWLHHDAVNRRLRPRRGARLAAITCGGAIPDTADYQVVLEPHDTVVGTVNEDFAIESMAGDIFQLGNMSWQIRRIEPGKVRVVDAAGKPPTIPFWFGEAPGRTRELSAAVSRLRAEVAALLENGGSDAGARAGAGEAGAEARNDVARAAAIRALAQRPGVGEVAARQLVDYLAAAHAALGTLPTQDTLVLERFFDEAGGMQLVVHSPYGSRLNRAWGLALRKRFCRSFNQELQAAATEDAIVLSLGPTHSFPLESVRSFLNSRTARDLLVQALLDAPLFDVRWRWNTTRALAILRFRGGRRVPPPLLRMQADDLLSLVFPDQAACLENIAGDRGIPDHPLVTQTIRDALEEAMDADGFLELLRRIEAGAVTVLARDLHEPSPLAAEILNARPYAFLDDAPLEERRTQAVASRRWLDPQSARDIGALDGDAVARVRDEAWPQATSADELHDALVLHGCLTEDEGARGEGWTAFFAELVRDGRAARLPGEDAAPPLWIAAERLPQWQALRPGTVTEPPLEVPARVRREAATPKEALVELVRARLEALGPVTAADLAAPFGVGTARIEAALAALESEGFVLRGHFTPDVDAEEWCERRLLARMHRYTLQRLRREIEPVPPAVYLRFLQRWQHVHTDTRLAGAGGLEAVLNQLEGYEVAAAAWESDVLPARVSDYEPAWLDAACVQGRVVWMRRSRGAPARAGNGGGSAVGEGALAASRPRTQAGPVRTTPIAILRRAHLDTWRGAAGDARNTGVGSTRSTANDDTTVQSSPALSANARVVLDVLRARGASFFGDLVAASRLLPAQVETALGELVAAGEITSDAFAGLRALLVPSDRRKPRRTDARARRRTREAAAVEDAGRWAALAPVSKEVPPAVTAGDAGTAGPVSGGDADESAAYEAQLETLARVLLRRWGVVFRKVLERESRLPPWRDVLRVLRRLEARGEIRGGRFVQGFAGEQYALSEAVTSLRRVRRDASRDSSGAAASAAAATPHAGAPPAEAPATDPPTWVSVSGADPLNLVGILTPHPRVPAHAANRILYREGDVVATRVAGKVHFWLPLEGAERWEALRALERSPLAPARSGRTPRWNAGPADAVKPRVG